MRILIATIVTSLMAGCHDVGESEAARNSPQPASAVVGAASEVASSSVVNSVSGVAVAADEAHVLTSDFKPKFEASDPAAPLEVAVMENVGGSSAIPVLSIPPDLRQFGGASGENIGARLWGEALEDISKIQMKICPKFEDQGDCNIPATLVAQHHYMSSVPKQWINAKGKIYQVLNGRYSSIGPAYIGFRLDKSRSSQESDSLVILNRKEGFPPSRLLASVEWQGWPELKKELHIWSQSRDASICKVPECKHSITWLATPEKLQGQAREYRLSDGRLIQFLQAKSETKEEGVLVKKPADAGNESYPDILTVNLWRIVETDGSVRSLKIGEHSSAWKEGKELWGAYLEYPYCESDCGSRWDGMPEVVNAQGLTFILAGNSRGTGAGILLFELLSSGLKYRGSYGWGT